MRLLSFLTAIERTLLSERSASDGSTWECSRMINFHRGLARLTLQRGPKAQLTSTAGTIFLQAFTLANGSSCLKATLAWNGSETLPVLAVFSTPKTGWKREASRIGAAWLNGPCAAQVASMSTEYLVPLAVAAS